MKLKYKQLLDVECGVILCNKNNIDPFGNRNHFGVILWVKKACAFK